MASFRDLVIIRFSLHRTGTWILDEIAQFSVFLINNVKNFQTNRKGTKSSQTVTFGACRLAEMSSVTANRRIRRPPSSNRSDPVLPKTDVYMLAQAIHRRTHRERDHEYTLALCVHYRIKENIVKILQEIVVEIRCSLSE